MKRILLYILLLYAHPAVAQISDDSLKNICKELYQSREKSKLGTYRIHPVDEAFTGYFKNVRIFVVRCDYIIQIDSKYVVIDHVPTFYSLYILNPETGKNIELNGKEEFNAVFEERRPVCNLDKCYLYLFLVEKTTDNITDPRDHRKVLSNNSVFLKDALPYYSYRQFGIVYHRSDTQKWEEARAQMNEDISISTKNNINIHTVSAESIYRYRFSFNRDGTLRSVSKALIK